MRRFIGLTVLLFFALPLGLSVTGCGHKSAPVQYCNAGDSGPVVGQVAQIILSSSLATVGESLNYGQIGQGLSASAQDCKGNSVSVSKYTYASTSSFINSANNTFADINPNTGSVCAGLWNRNTGGGIPDYTVCTAPTTLPVSASALLTLPTPSAATATTSSTTSLTVGQITDIVSGSLSLAVGASAPHVISLAANATLPTFANEINADATFTSEGVKAVFNTTTTVLTISGPVGASNTLVTTGTALTDNTVAFIAYVTATAAGATSNAIPVYVHPTVTGVVLGAATPSAQNGSCPAGTVDPGTDCCPNNTTGTIEVAPVYNGNGASCISQNKTGQLIARVYQNGVTTPANNITCQVGHLSYGTQNASNVVAIDQNGIATANQPGSTEITATIAQSSTATNAGFFSTCAPATIALTAQGYPANTGSVNVSLNNVQPLTASVIDTQGNPITGLALEFNSTQPQLIPGGAGSITPIFPGEATITAVCQPGTCNPSGFSQIGVLSNGKPVTSNGITIVTAGHSGTVIYAGSTVTATSPGSQYLFVQDFTTPNAGALIKLPYVPNSIAINLSGSAIYMGSSGGLMTFTTASNSVTSTNQAVAGNVLSVSPDGTTIVVTDPVRQTVSLIAASSSGVITTYGGVGTHAAWSPDTETVYVTTTSGTILSHATFTDWQTANPNSSQVYSDVAVTVPSVGAFFAGPITTDGRSYCSSTSAITTGNPPSATNTFLPLATQVTMQGSPIGRLGATNDGLHMLEANISAAGAPTFTDLDVQIPVQACPAVIPAGYFGTGGATTAPSVPLGVTATSITGVLPANNSAVAFVTYYGTSGLLPYYLIPATGTGTLSYLKLSNSATAPLAGVLSTDNSTLYVGTAGDNAVHQVGITYPTGGAPVVVDTATPLTPNLPSAGGSGTVPVNALVQYPKKTTT